MLVSTVGGLSTAATATLAPPSPSPFGLELLPPPRLTRRPSVRSARSARSVLSFRSWIAPPPRPLTAMRFESSSSLAIPPKAIRTSRDAVTTLQLYPGPVHKLLKGRTTQEISYKLAGLEAQLPHFAAAFALVRYFNNLGGPDATQRWPPDLDHIDQDVVDAARVTMNLVASRPATRRGGSVAAALFGALRPRTRSLSALKAARVAGSNASGGFSSLHLPRSPAPGEYALRSPSPSPAPAPLPLLPRSPPPRPTVITASARGRALSAAAPSSVTSPASSAPYSAADAPLYPAPQSLGTTPTTATSPTAGSDAFGMSINISIGTPSLRSLVPGGTTTPVSTPVAGAYPPQLSVRLPDLSLDLDGLFDFPHSPTLEGERAYTTDDIVERPPLPMVAVGSRPVTAFL
ncbi:hypothetical protein Q8F55_008177 [Vanrija albida]|uniref:Uncharacterized protein n=1 Tax=Vanrija albida TaxID=181172 RepID=A0ABR3PWH0_9TREE